MRPDKLKTATNEAAHAFHIHDSLYVRAVGINVNRNTIKCNARVLPSPFICDQNSRWKISEHEAIWQINRLLHPATCKVLF